MKNDPDCPVRALSPAHKRRGGDVGSGLVYNKAKTHSYPLGVGVGWRHSFYSQQGAEVKALEIKFKILIIVVAQGLRSERTEIIILYGNES